MRTKLTSTRHSSPQENDQLSFFSDTAANSAQNKSTPGYQNGKVYRLQTADLRPDPAQPRLHIDQTSLDELAGSISRHGILQPVLFRQTSDGQLYVIAGTRRLAAAKQAGVRTIPALCSGGDPAEISLVENLIRQDLTAIEEAEAIERFKTCHEHSLNELSGLLGKSPSSLSEIISLTRLPTEIREECRGDHGIARSILVEIAKLETSDEMIALYRRYRLKGLSRTDLRNKGTGSARRKTGFTRLFRSVSKQISAIDISELADTERKKVRSELQNLRKIIDDRLTTLDH